MVLIATLQHTKSNSLKTKESGKTWGRDNRATKEHLVPKFFVWATTTEWWCQGNVWIKLEYCPKYCLNGNPPFSELIQPVNKSNLFWQTSETAFILQKQMFDQKLFFIGQPPLNSDADITPISFLMGTITHWGTDLSSGKQSIEPHANYSGIQTN